ncbi:hypothetical protein A2797_00535 [candidate division WWE3 bacterium RIFCSPHIGHO2_01_FULL_48_15]|uniref:Uncharacterized protein n=1 Tax=candidate division WWE3 bacterium RIFCSPHIGHO2_01_FULL_48_15 TaxID=1802619 RepID=A0A1F4VGE9_UNCKA|nr:MAG: hypothetical protein A2797_00535 [candidate division WWE3 bacterium RIFCSPHIGHO2_01_FULL_48_15]
MDELAKLLGTNKETLEKLSDEMGEFTRRKDIPAQLLEKISAERLRAVGELGLSGSSPRKEVLTALGLRTEMVEKELLTIFDQPNSQDHAAIEKLFAKANALVEPPAGLFLKEKKVKEFLQANPPVHILERLGYGSVDELLAKEDLLEVYSALRFLEERKWLNEVFFAPFSKLKTTDFEKRKIVLRILDPDKWGPAARDFVRKKFHNTTHLKELGVVIVIPVEYTEGVITRMFSMMLHYLNEVSFYADLFKLFAKPRRLDDVGVPTRASGENDFAAHLVSALRGDVREFVPSLENIFSWVIMQRYLAKENSNDQRLLLPRISPEALHWKRAVANLAELGKDLPGLSFWANRAHLGGFFDNQLTSFNFEDNVFSLAGGPDTPQYTYHMREALWNRLFTDYFDDGVGKARSAEGGPSFDDGEKVLETLMLEEFTQGFIGFKIRASLHT